VRHLRIALLAILTVHAILLAWSATRNSPTFHEVPHLPAGLSHLLLGRFELYRVNPPLPRAVAAFPLLFLQPAPVTDWSNYHTYPTIRSEFRVGADFVRANGDNCLWLYTVARWACIPFSLVGALVCCRWAGLLYGPLSGVWAACLWCFCPFILGHAPLVMPDVPAAALGVAASFSFWKWLQRPSWPGTAASGIVLGLALLTKTTLLIFLPLWPILWCASRFRARLRPLNTEAAMLFLLMTTGIVVLNAGYCFDGSFKHLGTFNFVSDALSGRNHSQGNQTNRFVHTALASCRMPFPEQFVLGIDHQKAEFERPSPCYMDGISQLGGWWYFYLYALALKMPIGTMVLLAVSTALSVRHPPAFQVVNLVLPSVPVTILVLLSSQTMLTTHSRYALPVLPFLFIWASKSALVLSLRRFVPSTLVVLSLTGACASSLFAFPHDIAYFNEFAGGPQAGRFHLLDSNLAWGQDLIFLKEWVARHPDAQPLYVLVRPWLDPESVGIVSTRPWLMPYPKTSAAETGDRLQGPESGWYAVDVNFVQGGTVLALAPDELVTTATEMYGNVSYLRTIEPLATAGYSINIYHLDNAAAERMRQEIQTFESTPVPQKGP
jgi:hypothetical protein